MPQLESSHPAENGIGYDDTIWAGSFAFAVPCTGVEVCDARMMIVVLWLVTKEFIFTVKRGLSAFLRLCWWRGRGRGELWSLAGG